MAARPLAALTGATGFLGRRLAETLHDAGWRLRLLARTSASPPELEHLGPEIAAGRLADLDALDQLVEGADAVIHVAGAIKAARLPDFMAINRDGAAAVAKAAARRAPHA